MITDVKKDELLKRAGVKFLPFVGDFYEYGMSFDEEGNLVLGTKEKPGKKVLVLGEYHYCDEDISDEDKNSFTRDVVNKYLEASLDREKWERWMNTFLKFERAFYNRATEPCETKKFWEYTMFYNYLQVPLCETRMVGTDDDFEEAAKPFVNLLRTYSPDYIIVWGYQLYSKLPDEGGEQGPFLSRSIETWVYRYGSSIKVLPTYNPSAGFSWKYWNQVIVEFFK